MVHSKLLVPGSNKRILGVDRHIGLVSHPLSQPNADVQATAGLLADGKHLANRAREEASNFRETYSAPVSLQTLADRVSAYVQAYTCYGSVRPFGIATLMGGIDKTGPKLYCVEPSGVFYGYKAHAVGKGKALAKTELEKWDLENGTVRDGVDEVARM